MSNVDRDTANACAAETMVGLKSMMYVLASTLPNCRSRHSASEHGGSPPGLSATSKAAWVHHSSLVGITDLMASIVSVHMQACTVHLDAGQSCSLTAAALMQVLLMLHNRLF